MLTIVALLVLASSRVGKSGTAMGLGAAAILVFAMRECAGPESSVYSVPVRFWPPVLAVLSLVVLVKG